MKKKLTAIILLTLTAIMVFGTITVSASEPYQTYTYSIDGEALYSPAAYKPIPGGNIGAEYIFKNKSSFKSNELNTLYDISTDSDGNVYIVDYKAGTDGYSRVLVLDKTYRYNYEIVNFTNENGKLDSFNAAQGLFVKEYENGDKKLFVCDTQNFRIVVFDINNFGYTYSHTITRPQSVHFGEDSIYRPIAVAVDDYGRLFVVGASTYQGIIVMTGSGEFTGFIGAQKVTYTPIEMLRRRFMTAAQRANSKTYVSTEFNNLTIDEEGFIYVTTSTIDSQQQQSAIKSKKADYSPVKKLNSTGDEVMRRNGFFNPGGEVDITGEKFTSPSKVVDAGIGPEGTWSLIDQTRNKVFTYDKNGNLLFAFGDEGEQLGNTKSVNGIVYQKVNGQTLMILLDSASNNFTVYKATDYGNYIYDALKCENENRYNDAVDAWKNVLMYNNNFDAAYIGVGNSYYNLGNEVDEATGKTGYQLAIEYYEAAYDTDNRSNAYSEIRKEWISNYFFVIIIVLVVVIFAWTKFKKFAKKVNKAAIMHVGRKTYVEELLYVFHLEYHPFDGFWDLKHEKRGSVRAALTIMGITIIAFYYQSIGQGYMLNPRGTYISFFVQIISVAVPVLLWVVSNWCLTTLFDGEGSFKDIFIATGYSLAPLPLILIVCTICSNWVTSAEMGIISFLVSVGFVWVGILLFFGMMVTHDYSMGKNILITLFTIVGMAIIMFMALLFSSLIGKMLSFIASIITELSYRV
ncbi:MAG: YIP1 family protein [Eubacteriales bacterium]|nr:YIP1 family protein [Eubacteriales bacterium]